MIWTLDQVFTTLFSPSHSWQQVSSNFQCLEQRIASNNVLPRTRPSLRSHIWISMRSRWSLHWCHQPWTEGQPIWPIWVTWAITQFTSYHSKPNLILYFSLPFISLARVDYHQCRSRLHAESASILSGHDGLASGSTSWDWALRTQNQPPLDSSGCSCQKTCLRSKERIKCPFLHLRKPIIKKGKKKKWMLGEVGEGEERGPGGLWPPFSPLNLSGVFWVARQEEDVSS